MDTSKFATKEDLKKEISMLRSELRSESKSIRGEVLRVEGKVENTQEDIKDIKVILNKMSTTLDGFVGRVDDLTVDNEVGTHQTRELELKVEDLDKRVTQIESSKQAA
ncbi:MAG TPA: hypothetical protein VLG12_07580 [Candidatus Saccharimonadales bacterium]|nr:hypothetical protein [Candidatus Saccharimonadales bacterium]